jgi:hypothetical protein
MAISTYSELKTALTNWSKRTDLSTLLGDFIALAEARIQRSLLARVQEVETELTMTPGSRYVALPADFDSPVALWLKANLPREQLPQLLPEHLCGSNTSGYPEAWGIDGESIAFDKPASSAWAVDFRYCKPLALSDSAPTNYIMTNYPDVYLFGALVELHGYTFNDEKSAMAEARFQSALRDASDAEHASKTGAVLMTDVPGSLRQNTFNVIRGY